MELGSWFKKIKNKFIAPKQRDPEFTPHIEGIDLEHLPWWGSFQVAEEQSHYSKIGDMIICIDRFNQEWHLASYQEQQSDTARKTSKILGAYFDQDTVTLKPALPDRTTVFKLDYPLFVPHRTEMTLYTCAPVSIRTEIGLSSLFWGEITTDTLPDTWRGKNTQEGELCYAANIPASLRLDNMQADTWHTITPISVHNKTGEGIFLKEVFIPFPFLSIYTSTEHQLWTEQVKLFFEEVDQPDTLITQGPPQEINDPILISTARIYIKTGFKKLFGTLRGNS